MSRLLPLTSAPIALSVLVSLSWAPADSIAFAPADGTVLTKSFSTKTTLEIDEVYTKINGRDDVIPPMESKLEHGRTVTVTDTYVAVEGGRPTRLTRTFDGIEESFTMDVLVGGFPDNPKGTGTTELSGKTVAFTWDTEKGTYLAREDGEGDRNEELLDGLHENMDLRDLLPKKELAEGESYAVQAAALGNVFDAGGDLKMVMKTESYPGASGMNPSMMTDFRTLFTNVTEGEATGTYAGVKEIDGVKVAVIDLSVALTTKVDMRDSLEAMMNDGRTESRLLVAERMDVVFTCAGSGRLHWDTAKGHVHSFDLPVEITLHASELLNAKDPERKSEMECDLKLFGEAHATMELK